MIIIDEIVETRVNGFRAVECPKCHRYVGSFVGRAQCKSCGKWVDIRGVDKLRMPD